MLPMEGILTVPPDRGTIIGRALWKSRYVVVGPAQRNQPANPSMFQPLSSSRAQAGRGSTSRGVAPIMPSEGVFLSIYKSKDDWEPIQQHSVMSITDCQVQMLAHRKQGPVLPTLIINISPDPATDKLRKRRSSRTAGLTSTKDSLPSTLWFRPGPDKEAQHPLHDWARYLQQFLPSNIMDRSPLSPITPASPTFINPFAPRTRDGPEVSQRPNSGNPNAASRAPLQHKNSNQTHSSRERPVTYSESPSLRSKRSDLSSHASSMNPSHAGFQNYTTMHPADLPSPATTIGEYQGEFIEGWTAAQGRSSTLSSPIRGRDSISSQPYAQSQATMDSSSPPGPRETILDRAFQLRYIPGSDRNIIPGEEKLSSLARFDALMREADDKRVAREAAEAKARAAEAASGLKSAWDLDDSDDDEEVDSDDGDDDSDDEPVGEMDRDATDDFMIPPTTQRALNYIARRHDPSEQPTRAQGVKSPLSYNHEALMALSSNSGSSHLRPQTGYSRNRPGVAQRTHSQPQLANNPAVLASLNAISSNNYVADMQPSSSNGGRTWDDAGTAGTSLQRSATEKRQSVSSTKRLSFTEFTKRLSSTSSLLIVQTNQSAQSGSSRGSSTTDVEYQPQSGPRGNLAPRGGGTQSPLPQSDRDRERCAWRGSVGVFGTEGGFL